MIQKQFICHQSQCISTSICLLSISVKVFILDGKVRCLWRGMPFRKQHWGGFSQLTCCQSAVKQTHCSLCSLHHSERWPCAPCPSRVRLLSAWGGTTPTCLPFMGWNRGGHHRGGGMTPTATALIYCVDKEKKETG